MNDLNERELFTDFPTFFQPDKTPAETLMCFGFECSDGWFELIYKLCEDIKKLNPPENFEVIQVKEKFGGLRFYADNGTSEIYERIHQAEQDSYTICENCGAPAAGAKRIRGWVSTLCEHCAPKT